MKIVKFSSHRMRQRGLDFAAIRALVGGFDCPVPVYSWDRAGGKGMYLMDDELADAVVSEGRYVGKSKPSVLKGKMGDLMWCHGAEPTEEQRKWILEVRG